MSDSIKVEDKYRTLGSCISTFSLKEFLDIALKTLDLDEFIIFVEKVQDF